MGKPTPSPDAANGIINPYAPPATDVDAATTRGSASPLRVAYFPHPIDTLRVRIAVRAKRLLLWATLVAALATLHVQRFGTQMHGVGGWTLSFALVVVLREPVMWLLACFFAGVARIFGPTMAAAEHTAEIADDAFIVTTSAYRLSFDWPSLRRVARMKRGIVVWTAAGITIILPRRAFTTAADFEQYAQAVLQRTPRSRTARFAKP